MASVLCDPNYDPGLYRDIEALLFLYDQVCLYSPSHGQIQMAGVDWRRIDRLVENGFVIPVGRGFWFDPAERTSLCRKNAANAEKIATYRWSALDDRILNLGPTRLSEDGRFRSPGYVVVSNAHRTYAEMMERLAPRNCPTEFAALIARARVLSKDRLLPVELMRGKFVSAPIERLAGHLVFYTAGDLLLGDTLGVASVFSTPQMGIIYDAVARWFLRSSSVSTGPRVAIIDPAKEYRLTPEEIRVAASLAQQIVDDDRVGPLDLDLLLEYRSTACSRMFRDFVSNALNIGPRRWDSENPGDGSRLKKIFDATAAWIDNLADYGPWVGGITLGALGSLWLDKKVEKKSFTRRSFLTVVAALSFGAFSERVAPNLAERFIPSVVAHRYDTMFAIVHRQRQRR